MTHVIDSMGEGVENPWYVKNDAGKNSKWACGGENEWFAAEFPSSLFESNYSNKVYMDGSDWICIESINMYAIVTPSILY